MPAPPASTITPAEHALFRVEPRGAGMYTDTSTGHGASWVPRLMYVSGEIGAALQEDAFGNDPITPGALGQRLKGLCG